MPISKLHDLVKDELIAVDQLIQQQLSSQAALTEELGKHITQAGGKRLRPLLVLLGAALFDCRNEQAITLAAIIELTHTVSLLHDDVIDESSLRRGKKTANAIWGNKASILVGDFLYSRTYQLTVTLKNLILLDMLAKTGMLITEGEVLQLQNCHNPDVTENNYMQIITSKTGALFSAAAQMGALLTERPPEEVAAMAAYGSHLGIAFQLIDDALDYCANPDQTGKNLGDDLAEGKTTLPLIYAMKVGNEAEKRLIQEAIRNGGPAPFEQIVKTIQSTGALDIIRQRAKIETQKAIEAISIFPDSIYRQALLDLVAFALDRTF
ncbi:MAG: polyprenyl synthetase family protein [Gammaproteobacteria bacterium]|nr:polyprenyl synthetase family protein [Gammaproteobacteria bacterium]